jgi:HK97 family phage major capsid protein
MQQADRPGDVHVAKPGEVRMLTKQERLSEVHTANDEFRGIDLGRLVGMMTGQYSGDAPLERRALATFTDSLGGFACPESVSREIIDAARNQTRCIQAGALTFQMDAAKVRIPTLDTEPSGQWKPEGLNAEEDDCELGAIEFQARSLFFWLVISRELWQDAAMLSATLQNSIASAAAMAIDYACLMGSGNGEEPRGLYFTDGVTKTAVDAVAYDAMSNAMYRVENQNYSPTGIILSPRTANWLRKLKDGEGQYMTRPTWLPPVHVTKQVPDNLEATTNKSLAFVGQWDRLWIGVRDTLRLEVLREIKSQSGQIVLMGAMRADCGAVRPGAFQIISNIGENWTA